MTRHLDAVRRSVNAWLSVAPFSHAYIFGSLIHKDGAQFDAQLSDVDLICRIEPGEKYLARWTSVMAAAESVGALNLQLLKDLGRKDASKPIASVVPVNSFELKFGLHKDKASQFFSHNDFFCVSTGVKGPIGNEHKNGTAKIEGALDSVREAQRVRNKVLATAPAGTRAVDGYNGPDVLPKTFARCAAQVRWAREKNPKPEQRFDVNEGLVYALQLIAARRNEDSAVEELLQRLVVRMGGRGESSSISVSDQVLIWEILVDEACALVLPKARAAERAIAARSTLPIRVSPSTRQQAFERAGYRCAFPDCSVPLGKGGIGEVAYISSPTPGGPRYDRGLDRDAAVSVENLVVLCPTHHRLVDSSPTEYSVERMKSWNRAAEPKSPHSAFSSESLFTIVKLIVELLPKTFV